MARKLTQILADLPPERRSRVDARYRELKEQVESLAALRRLAGRMQTEIAEALDIRQPSVSKIEKQQDMYLSTLRNYVEAIGGELELVVRLPDRRPLRLLQPGSAGKPSTSSDRSASRAVRPRVPAKPRSSR